MSTFVLVHGSWAGGWHWADIRARLEQAGHRVHAPSLTGMADRHHLAGEHVGLHTHIDDVARLLEWERLTDVILVGHSYGGMVITGAAARVPERIAHVVYLDAFLPRAGEAAWDLLPWQREAFQQLRLPDRPWLVRPIDAAAFFPELGEGFDDNRPTPMPIATHEQPVPDAPAPGAPPGTYIHCTAAPAYFDDVARRAADDGLAVVTLDAGHMALLTHADEVSATLLALAQEAPR